MLLLLFCIILFRYFKNMYYYVDTSKRFQQQLLEIIQHKENELFETLGALYTAEKAEIRTNQMTI